MSTRPDLAEIDALVAVLRSRRKANSAHDIARAADALDKFSALLAAETERADKAAEDATRWKAFAEGAWKREKDEGVALTAAQAEIATLTRERDEARAEHLLAAYDAFLSGLPITDAQKATADHVARAAVFGSAAYDAGICDGQATHAMIRSILVALIDPMHPDLDYLRADPEAARKARAAAPRAEGEAADGE